MHLNCKSLLVIPSQTIVYSELVQYVVLGVMFLLPCASGCFSKSFSTCT